MTVGSQIKRLGSETLIYGISGTLSRLITIFLVPFYARAFPPSEYGYINIVNAMIALLSSFIVLGLDSASARWYYDTEDRDRRQRLMSSWFWCQMMVGVLIGAGLVLLARPLAAALLDDAARANIIMLAGLVALLSTFGKVLGNWLRYQRRAWTAMLFFTFSSLVVIGAIVLFVLVLRGGMTGLFAGQVVAGLLAAGIAVWLLRGWIAPGKVTLPLLREMLIYGLPLVPAALAGWVTMSADRFILKGFVPAAEIGLYGAASALASGMLLVTGAFQMAWPPFAFSISGQPGAKQVYRRVFSIYALAGCFLATAISLFAPLLLQVLTTPEYYPAFTAVPFLAFGYLAMGAMTITALGANLAKKSGPVGLSIFAGAVVNTALNFALIPVMGKEGAAVATFVAYAAVTAYLYRASQQLYPIPYRPLDVLACLGLSAGLIALDRLLLPGGDMVSYGVRGLLCLAFVPLAFGLGILRPAHITAGWHALTARQRRKRSN